MWAREPARWTRDVVGREGFEPPCLSDLVYSQASRRCSTDPLTDGPGPRLRTRGGPGSDVVAGADDGTRTRNLRFTKPLLYQLSYVGTTGRAIPQMTRIRRRGMIGPAARMGQARTTSPTGRPWAVGRGLRDGGRGRSAGEQVVRVGGSRTVRRRLAALRRSLAALGLGRRRLGVGLRRSVAWRRRSARRRARGRPSVGAGVAFARSRGASVLAAGCARGRRSVDGVRRSLRARRRVGRRPPSPCALAAASAWPCGASTGIATRVVIRPSAPAFRRRPTSAAVVRIGPDAATGAAVARPSGSRCATASNRRIEPATAALSDPIAPRIGIRMNRSHRRRMAGPSPWPSLPTTIASGPRRSLWRAVSGASASAPATRRPWAAQVGEARRRGRRPGRAAGARPRRPTP